MTWTLLGALSEIFVIGTTDEERREAIIALMDLPDPPELRRSYRYTQPRDPRRDADAIKRDLGMAYVQRRCHERGADVSGIVSLRRHNRLRLAKRA